MNRIQRVRSLVDDILLRIEDDEERRCAYVHLYGVSMACSLLAQKRKLNVELAVIAGMLHDIYSYSRMDPEDHAHKGAEMVSEILNSMDIFTEKEKNLICSAIWNHSDKSSVHDPLSEILKDADVMQHGLYSPLSDVKKHEQQRYDSLKIEFGL